MKNVKLKWKNVKCECENVLLGIVLPGCMERKCELGAIECEGWEWECGLLL